MTWITRSPSVSGDRRLATLKLQLLTPYGGPGASHRRELLWDSGERRGVVKSRYTRSPMVTSTARRSDHLTIHYICFRSRLRLLSRIEDRLRFSLAILLWPRRPPR